MSNDFSPREIVSELDKHIVGQLDAKRAVAVALRNRWRRQQLSDDLKEEVLPKNILMMGPTGVGKTEIARRLARLARLSLWGDDASTRSLDRLAVDIKHSGSDHAIPYHALRVRAR